MFTFISKLPDFAYKCRHVASYAYIAQRVNNVGKGETMVRIGLLCRNLNIFDTEATLLQLALEITDYGRECFIFTADQELKVQKPVMFASFYAVSGGQLKPIEVTEQRQG